MQGIRALIRSRLARVLILILISLSILVLSLTPKPLQILESISYSDKLEHGVAYMVLAFFTCGAFVRKGYLPLILAILICVAYGGAIEIVQPFFGRKGDLLDFATNVAGATAGAVTSGLILRKITVRTAV